MNQHYPFQYLLTFASLALLLNCSFCFAFRPNLSTGRNYKRDGRVGTHMPFSSCTTASNSNYNQHHLSNSSPMSSSSSFMIANLVRSRNNTKKRTIVTRLMSNNNNNNNGGIVFPPGVIFFCTVMYPIVKDPAVVLLLGIVAFVAFNLYVSRKEV
uniref:Transmembrane protein n=1 Tax=Ditylum brightwellii TaxID=49249 RepID=A0A7S1ZHM6_9STRA|mmetsp:Transcript_31869/g.47540  ORF Transcript_31869/g.47540 Transcript_31869/m.47540 type:complete len:155 (+) Transcript_31869:29-493(+)